MYGRYDIPFNVEAGGIIISAVKEGEKLVYRRECGEEKAEKILMASSAKALINPVEPLKKPKDLTPYLLTKFEKALLIEPRSTKRVFLKFPIEIGAYVSTNEDFELIDIFTLARQKFTIYGDPANGVLCKYWKSEVYDMPPSADPVQEGIMELKLSNPEPEWFEVTKAVFNAFGMKIYYDDNKVSMKAHMNLKAGQFAETDFEDCPLEGEMRKSLEVYMARKLSVTSPKFTMEFGL